MNEGISSGIHDAVLILRRRPDIRVVVLTGTGRMFCAGGDPKTFQAEQEAAGVAGRGFAARAKLPSGPDIVSAADRFAEANARSARAFAWDMYHWSSLPQFTICC